MDVVINPTVAYLLIFIGVMLLLIMFNDSKTIWPKASAMAFCLLAGTTEFLLLNGNPWGFLTVVISPLPYFVAIRQGRQHSILFVLTIFMLTMGSAYLFVDESGQPLANLGVAGMLSIFAGLFLWLIIQRGQATDKTARNVDSVVGLTGEVWIAIEPFSIGSVRIDGEIWQARSKQMLSAGTLVRVIRQHGSTLTVKKIENIKSSMEK